MIKFSTECGVVEVRGDQVAAWECYIAMLEMDDRLQIMCIKEQRTVVEPMEGLEEVLLDDSRPERTTKIGILTSPPVYQALITFLRENLDVFA